jgi:hypothetical protein
MPTFQILAVRGHEAETLYVEQCRDPFFPLERHAIVDGRYEKSECFGFVEADTADAARAKACESLGLSDGQDFGGDL